MCVRSQTATGFFQHRPGSLPRLAPDQVEHHVDLAHHVFELLLFVIDYVVRADLSDELDKLLRNGRDHVGTLRLRELDGERVLRAARMAR